MNKLKQAAKIFRSLGEMDEARKKDITLEEAMTKFAQGCDLLADGLDELL